MTTIENPCRSVKYFFKLFDVFLQFCIDISKFIEFRGNIYLVITKLLHK